MTSPVRQVCAAGFLPKSDTNYIIVLQTAADAVDVATFHAKVHQNTDSHFLMARNQKDFDTHFEQGHLVIAVLVGGKTVAQSLIMLPESASKNSGMTDMQLPGTKDNVAVLCGMTVDPEYRGNGLQGIMTKAAINLVKDMGRDHLIAEVAVDNQASWRTFLKENMQIVSIGKDSSDGTELYNLHVDVKKLTGKFNQSSEKSSPVTCSQFNIAAQRKLIADGYCADSYDSTKNSFVFIKKEAAQTPANDTFDVVVKPVKMKFK